MRKSSVRSRPGFSPPAIPGLALGALLTLLAAAPVRADNARDRSGSSPDAGDMLRIPGLPPIQTPPGARVFGPNGPAEAETPPPAAGSPADAPKAAEVAPRPPAPDVHQPAGRRKILDELFDKLAKATDDDEAKVLAAAIERVWMVSGSDTADLLMTRVGAAMEAKDWSLGEEVLDKIVEIAPDWAEGWNKRATVRFSKYDYSGAVADIAHVLALEPRHFGALAGLGFILRKMDMDKLALRAFRAALDVNPRQEELRKMVETLSLEVDGRDI